MSATSSSSLNGSTAQMLAPYAAGFPNDVLGMMPYFYPGLAAAAAGYYPGTAGLPFLQPPGLLPGTRPRRPRNFIHIFTNT